MPIGVLRSRGIESAFQGGWEMLEGRRRGYWSMRLDDEHTLENFSVT